MRQFLFLLLAALTGCASISPGLHSNIEYGNAGGESLKLDAFVPERNGPFPMAIVVHGGGWGGGDKAKDITPLLSGLGDAHFVWFSINYRLAPKYQWPDCYDDVQTAIRWVKANAISFHGDAHRIALIGYSAGGQLACLTAVRGEAVDAVVGLSPPTDMEADTKRRRGLSKSLIALLGTNVLDDRVHGILHDMSAINYVHAGLPSFLLIHGTVDKSVPYEQSINFRQKLMEFGVPCELVTLQGAPHDINKWAAIDNSYAPKMIEWLRRTIGAAGH